MNWFLYKYINTYENASFNKANEIYVKTFERYNIHAVYSDNEIGSDVDYIPETNKFIIVEDSVFSKLFNYTTTTINYRLFKRLSNNFKKNLVPIVIRITFLEHIMIGILHNVKGINTFELFNSSGKNDDDKNTNCKIVNVFEKYFNKNDIEVVWFCKNNLQSFYNDNLCQTWICYYIKNRLYDKKSSEEIYYDYYNDILEDNMMNKLLKFLYDLYHNE